MENNNLCPFTGQPCPNHKNITVTKEINSSVVKMQLCQNCAEQALLFGSKPPPSVPLLFPVSDDPIWKMFEQIFNSPTEDKPFYSKEDDLSGVLFGTHHLNQCPTCNTSLAQIMETGRIGCPNCYFHFQDFLKPVVGKCQNNAVKHTGKRPRHLALAQDIEALKKQMQKAVDEERYEDAALIRDKIKELSN